MNRLNKESIEDKKKRMSDWMDTAKLLNAERILLEN